MAQPVNVNTLVSTLFPPLTKNEVMAVLAAAAASGRTPTGWLGKAMTLDQLATLFVNTYTVDGAAKAKEMLYPFVHTVYAMRTYASKSTTIAPVQVQAPMPAQQTDNQTKLWVVGTLSALAGFVVGNIRGKNI